MSAYYWIEITGGGRSVLLRARELDVISDKIRKGEPVGYLEALAACAYQEDMKKERDAANSARGKPFWGRLWRWVHGL